MVLCSYCKMPSIYRYKNQTFMRNVYWRTFDTYCLEGQLPKNNHISILQYKCTIFNDLPFSMRKFYSSTIKKSQISLRRVSQILYGMTKSARFCVSHDHFSLNFPQMKVYKIMRKHHVIMDHMITFYNETKWHVMSEQMIFMTLWHC